MANAVKIRPLGQNVLLRRLEAEEKTKGGIYLPDTAKEKPREGEILAVGEGELDKNGKRRQFSVKEGDRVIFSSYAGTDYFELSSIPASVQQITIQTTGTNDMDLYVGNPGVPGGSQRVGDYLLRSQKCSKEEVERWLKLLSDAFDDHTYFFSLSRFVCILRK